MTNCTAVSLGTMRCEATSACAFVFSLLLYPLCNAFVPMAPANTHGVVESAINTARASRFGGRVFHSDALQLKAASEFGGIQHAGVLVSDAKTSKEFYLNVLGFDDDSSLRPDNKLPFDGAFVRAGNTQIHLMELPNPDPVDGRPEHGGRDRHVAFTIQDLGPLKMRLDNAGVTYTMSKSGRAALFCRDLDGNAFEFIQQEF